MPTSRGEAPEVLTDSLGFLKPPRRQDPHDSTVDPQVFPSLASRHCGSPPTSCKVVRSWLMESSPTSLRQHILIGLVDEKETRDGGNHGGIALYVSMAGFIPGLSLLEWWRQTFYPQQPSQVFLHRKLRSPASFGNMLAVSEGPHFGLAAGLKFSAATLRQLAATQGVG